MITNEDILLSKMSYTDKDFGEIYPDLLDLTKKLTNKWDPSLSNESDPGVVLLKEGAFVADHLNYNIDKNILENFLPSATQESSVRNILDMNGYNPRYYVSATGEVAFSYTMPTDSKSSFPETGFTIPAFTLQISNDDSSVVYTQTSSLVIIKEGVKASASFIEGTLDVLTIGDSNLITIENLDDNHRIYLPTRNVAQNGIYIYDSEGDSWKKSNYLLTEPIRSKVYKVGFDSAKNLPYIEFPSDISDIIGDGLNITYIITSGLNGNISAKTLTQIISGTSYEDPNTGLTISFEGFELSNNGSITNGKDPETIDEMYSSFKKIVGTFNTLVTKDDYSNAVNTMVDSYDNKLVSNCVVTDRTCDYNNSIDIITYDQYGEYFENASLVNGIYKIKFVTPKPDPAEAGMVTFSSGQFEYYNGADWVPITEIGYEDFLAATECMSPFDLTIHALKAFSMSDYSEYQPQYALNKSYTPADNISIGMVKEGLTENKCINHTFKDVDSNQIVCFKNYLPLDIIITPYSKVDTKTKNDIIGNIYKALTQNFNASNIDFGYEVDYDEVYKVIVNSDDRIRDVKLSFLDEYVNALYNNGNEVNLFTNSALLVDMLAKNILAGRLCLFEFDDDFTYRFGQIDSNIYKGITSVKTEVIIDSSKLVESSAGPYTLNNNEYIHIAKPNYSSDTIYPANIWYRFESLNTVAKDTDYKLTGSEKLKFKWTSGSEEKQVEYVAGDIIKANFRLEPTNTGTNKIWVNSDNSTTTEDFIMLSSNQQIEHRTLLKTELSDNYLACYWIRSNENNMLFQQSESSIVLGSGEYFMYTNATRDAFVIFGSGTKITRYNAAYDSRDWSAVKTTIENVDLNGVSINVWKEMNFSGTDQQIDIQEMEFYTLSYGDDIQISGLSISSEGFQLDNNWRNIGSSATIQCTIAGESVTLGAYFDGYLIRSRLDLNIGKDTPQGVYDNQTIEFIKDSTSVATLSGSSNNIIYLQCSEDLNLINDTASTFIEPLNFRYYKLSRMVEQIGGTTKIITQENTGHYNIVVDTAKTIYMPFRYRVQYDEVSDKFDKTYLIPVYIKSQSEANIIASIMDNGSVSYPVKIREYNSGNTPVNQLYLTEAGMHILEAVVPRDSSGTPIGLDSGGVLEGNVKFNIIINNIQPTTEVTYITIFDPVIYYDLNEGLIIQDEDGLPLTSLESVLARIKELVAHSNKNTIKPYYIYKPDNSIAIQDKNFTPASMWDKNNIANILTIQQLDIKNSSLNITKSMLRS